jgi:hypothetical protein
MTLPLQPTRDDDAVHKLIAVCCCVKKRNTPEFMAYFAGVINAAIQERGSDDRVQWPGAWANEFHLVSGS